MPTKQTLPHPFNPHPRDVNHLGWPKNCLSDDDSCGAESQDVELPPQMLPNQRRVIKICTNRPKGKLSCKKTLSSANFVCFACFSIKPKAKPKQQTQQRQGEARQSNNTKKNICIKQQTGKWMEWGPDDQDLQAKVNEGWALELASWHGIKNKGF